MSTKDGVYYHLSPVPIDKFVPRLPHNSWMAGGDVEDNVTPRICVSPTIEQCLIAIDSDSLEGREFFVYKFDVNQYEFQKPDLYEVMDVQVTEEGWIKEEAAGKLIGKIRVDPGSLEVKEFYHEGTDTEREYFEYTYSEI